MSLVKVKQELYDIVSKCGTWKEYGKCANFNGTRCCLFAHCNIIQAHDKKMAEIVKRDNNHKIPYAYLPGIPAAEKEVDHKLL